MEDKTKDTNEMNMFNSIDDTSTSGEKKISDDVIEIIDLTDDFYSESDSVKNDIDLDGIEQALAKSVNDIINSEKDTFSNQPASAENSVKSVNPANQANVENVINSINDASNKSDAVAVNPTTTTVTPTPDKSNVTASQATTSTTSDFVYFTDDESVTDTTSAVQAKKTRKPIKLNININKDKVLKGFLVFAGVLLLIYIGGIIYTKSHFIAGTKINQIDVGNMSKKKAEEKLSLAAKNFEMHLAFRESDLKTITGHEINYSYVSDGSVEKLLDEQNDLLWFMGFFEDTEKTVPMTFEYDKQKLEDIIASYDETNSENMKAPINAYIAYDSYSNSFEIQSEYEGTTMNIENVYKGVEDVISKGGERLGDIEIDSLEGTYEEPTVRSDNGGLVAMKEILDKLCDASVEYTLPSGNTRTVDINETINWLAKDEAGGYALDEPTWEAKAHEYVEGLAADVDNVGGTKIFNATGVGQVTVTGGEYGWKIDVDGEAGQLASELKEGTVVKREPAYSCRQFSTENSGIGNNYVEIDVSRQHLWVYRDGALAFETDIVSGTMIKAKYTPTGIYYIDYKQRDRVLKGDRLPNGTYEYHTLVHYWVPFNGGIGIHDAYWRSKFGGDIYVKSGSHGCINVPASAAPVIYDLVDLETPIVVYNTQPYNPE